MYKQDKDSVEYYLLKHSHFTMMKNSDVENKIRQYNKKIGYAINKAQILELIIKINSTLKSAYERKEDYLDFN